MKHLYDMKSFVEAFKGFNDLLAQHKLDFTNEENICRLFDIWLANHKDERVLEAQLKKEAWENDD